MRTPSLLLLLSIIAFGSNGQISSRLQQHLNNTPEETFHTIRIEFTENVNCYAMSHQFKQNRTALDVRAKEVIAALQNQAGLSQAQLLETLNTELGHETRNVHAFWVVNLMVMDATAQAIRTLAELPTVALIDMEDAQISWHDPIIQGEASSERSPNGIEPGLQAINAPAMWALGYTGRGRMVYNYDTGVWPTHLAFADRFLAHRFPMSQCWYGFFNNSPNGSVEDHGTHTLGTMAGLIKETNDTIGVAYKAYWIANDFVTPTVAELPPLAAMMSAFEWALNPDGDINTTNDIPDVINNSWRWRDEPDTVQCAGPVVSLMNAIEAAGIANVFSGGNSGPGNTTVNAPQRINTSEVNTFSVGSVDGNQDFPYPISNFSTRGPTQCDHTGSISLEIHPEVVAPGQNVRSAWGTDEFNTISGTSMAAPHVSGAILLLKEAFPYLSGEELLWALYLSAVDLGEVGEDNTFGRGIIDVHAAFEYLAQTNTPVDPADIPWDLSIVSATNPVPNGISCENEFATSVTIENVGDNTISTVHFQYDINGTGTQHYTWNGTLTAGNSTVVALPSITTTEFGLLDLNILASIDGQTDEYDLFNNRWRLEFDRRDERALPFTEEFEYGFELNNWSVQNPDGSITWKTLNTNGLQWGTNSATVQCYDYGPRENQKDGLITPILNLPTTTEPLWLLFDVAYQKRTTNEIAHDSLQVRVSTDCGQSFNEILYNKAGDDLITNDSIEHDFSPLFEWDWRRDSVLLSGFSGMDVLVNFQTTNQKGNNIYIDNIKIFEGNTEPISVADIPTNEIHVHPNPTEGTIYIESLFELEDKIDLRIYNAMGAEVTPMKCFSAGNNNRIEVDVRSLTYGLYILSVSDERGIYNTRFIKN